jgi:hypothetical protein
MVDTLLGGGNLGFSEYTKAYRVTSNTALLPGKSNGSHMNLEPN